LLKGLKSTIKWIAAIVIICVVAVFLASINGLSVSRTVMTVGGNEITEAEYKYYLESVKQVTLSEQGITDEDAVKDFLKNGTIDGKPAKDVIKEKALEEITRVEIACIKAKEAGIELTDEEKSSARAILTATDSETKAQLDELKKATGLTKQGYANIMEKSYLVNSLYSKFTTENADLIVPDDDEVTKTINEEFALVKHVLVSKPGEDSETTVEDAKKKAEEALAKATSGEDFDALVKEYGEDPGMESEPNGYLITKTGSTLDGQSTMVAEFTKGSFAVGVNEVKPELVESDYGWHIIKRYEITAGNDNYSTVQQQANSILVSEMYSQYIDTFKDEVEIVVNDRIINKIKVKY